MKRAEKKKIKRRYWKRKHTKKSPATAGGKVMHLRASPLTAYFSDTAMTKILTQVEGDVYHECGAFLIGNLMTDHITGHTIAIVDDVYSDGEYGTPSNYSFSSHMQVKALNYIERNYGDAKHMIGTVHSHAQFDAFYSGTDYDMMNSRRSEEIHMVLSPSHRTFVLTYKDMEFVYHNDIELADPAVFGYRRNPQ